MKAVLYNATDEEVTLKRGCSYFQIVPTFYHDGFVLLDTGDQSEAESPPSPGRSMDMSEADILDDDLEAVLSRDGGDDDDVGRGEGAFGSTGSTGTSDEREHLAPASPHN